MPGRRDATFRTEPVPRRRTVAPGRDERVRSAVMIRRARMRSSAPASSPIEIDTPDLVAPGRRGSTCFDWLL